MDTKCRIRQLVVGALLLIFCIIEAANAKDVAVSLDHAGSPEYDLVFEPQVVYEGDLLVFQTEHGSRDLHKLLDEEAFRRCDFSGGVTLGRTDAESPREYTWRAGKEGMLFFATRTQAAGVRRSCNGVLRWPIIVRGAKHTRRQSAAIRRLQQAPARAPASPAPVATSPPPVNAAPASTPPISSQPPASTPPTNPPPVSPPPATPPPVASPIPVATTPPPVATPPPASPPPATPPPTTPPPTTPSPATPSPVASPTPSASPPAPPPSPTPATSPSLSPGPSTSPPAPSVPSPSPFTSTVSTTGSPAPAGSGAAVFGALVGRCTLASVVVFVVAMLQ